MQTVTVQITNNDAIKALEALVDKRFISIVDRTDFDSPALPGKALSLSEFKNWVHQSENDATISLSEAKSRWANKRKQLQKLTK